MVKRLVIFILVIMGTSCENGMYEILNRDTDDPSIETPQVLSFRVSNTTLVSWSDDSRADEYMLQRAYDSESPLWKTIYQGKGTSYQDTGLLEDHLYLYRLAKRRGGKIFNPSEPALGIGHIVEQDVFEPNNTLEQAVRLYATDIAANMYYYRSSSGLAVKDEDWYYVDIPARRKAVIQIIDLDIIPGDNDSHFKLYDLNVDATLLTHEQNIELLNDSDFTQRRYFKLYPNESKYFSPDSVMVGGTIVTYIVRLVAISI